jgi:hypothetical protein
MQSFASVFMCFHCFHCRNMYFWYISHVYKNTHVPYITYEMHSFASVFMCFTVFSLQIHILMVYFICLQKHMYHILYMKCTILLVFSCFFIVFPLQKHVLLVHFRCIQKYTCTIYYTWNVQFYHFFYGYSLCFYYRNMYLWYI